jgi:lysine 2,3-aminomutase
VYCRFCTRKRKIGKWPALTDHDVDNVLQYIRCSPGIHDVLLSGGDPFLISEDRLEYLLRNIKAISHVSAVRIGTRTPVADPESVTRGLIRLLRKYRPLFILIHVNHPAEISPEFKKVCRMLTDAGVILGTQTVLLRGINDSPETMTVLMRDLLAAGVRPYYLLHADLTRGTHHFRTPIQTGLDIMAAMRGRLSGLGIPHYVIDLPGGRGKVPLLPEYLETGENGERVIRDWRGEKASYPDIR